MLRKNDLEVQLDEFISGNAARFQNDPRLVSYFTSRARVGGSPVKREIMTVTTVAPELRVSRRRATRGPADEIAPAEIAPTE